MAYCSQTDIMGQLDEDVLVQLTDDDNEGEISGGVVTRAIEDAGAEIDAYCSSRYDVPFSPVPAVIRKISVDMAVYHLYARRQGAPPDRLTRYEASVRLLKDIAKGMVSIGADAMPASGAGAASDLTAQDRTFSRSALGWF